MEQKASVKNQKKIKTRLIKPSDYSEITAMQLRCFPNMKPWSEDQFNSILKMFPDGQICIEYNKKIVASCCSLIIRWDDYDETSSWNEFTENGFFTNHTINGDSLYGAEIMVDPEYRGMKLARRLYEERKKIAIKYNVKKIAIGGRLPKYKMYSEKYSVFEYVEKVIDRKIYDPVLTTQLSNGFVLKKILPDYLPNDKESCGYATYLEWTNLQYITKKSDSRLGKSPYVRIAAIQYQMRMIKNFKEFENNCEYFVDIASDYRSDFVVFPEMLTMQLLTFLPKKKPGTSIRMLNNFTERYIELFSNLAIEYNINIIGGTHFAIENDTLYNIAYIFKRNGTYEKQYKIHITPHERKWWGVKPGNKVEIFDTDCGKVAILICYDVEFPELSRIAAAKGAKIIFVPFNTDDRRGYLRVRYCAQARAVENQLYLALSGPVGNLPNVENLDIHYAQSVILTPSDAEFSREGVASEASANTETMIFQDVDLNLLRRNREQGSVQTWNDRRTDLYKVVYNEDGKTAEI